LREAINHNDSCDGCPLAEDWADLIRQVKEANDIVDVVGGYISLRPAGPTYKALCPFHDDHNPSFDVDPRRQRYKCWSCGKHGDVISFVQEHEHIDFRDALELLARRAGISLEKTGRFQQNPERAGMLDVLRWSCEQFQQCLLDDPQAEAARRYLGERRFVGETVRRYTLGFAPPDYNWLVNRAHQAGKSAELLEKLGLIARRNDGNGFYDRFRDRIIFPIRNVQGHTVGFGGRILPSSPSLERTPKPPKYYNSSDSPLFTKSEHLYGIDQAKQSAAAAGYLAVVEGYTDVLMAHQLGINQVVATMGTALNARHVKNLRRFVPKVILVFDADEGGETGVDRALEIFASQDVNLAVATLPGGMDPFDLLVAQGAEPFKVALENAVDALEFKLQRVLAADDGSIESRRRGIDAVLHVIALAPELTGQAGALKRDLMINRIAERLSVDEVVVRKRLGELKDEAQGRRKPVSNEPVERSAPAPQRERELLQVLLAEPALVAEAAAEVAPAQIEHPGLRQLLEGLYALHAEGGTVGLDQLRPRIDNPRLVETALKFEEVGRMCSDRTAWLRLILTEFKKRRLEPEKRELQKQLRSAVDHTDAIEKLRQLQTRTDF
jgi:DNA primase